jgi:hypothetical protein
LATEAGRLLLEVRAELSDAPTADRKAQGDKRSHDFLMAQLARTRPDDAVLSEEGVDNPVRLVAERVWIVDPVDGTREFSELDRDDWAVHVALWERGDLAAGAVALPGQGVTSMFSFGRSVGQVEGLLAGARIPVSYVTPQSWQKAVGMTKGPDGARHRASQLMPELAHLWPLKRDAKAAAASPPTNAASHAITRSQPKPDAKAEKPPMRRVRRDEGRRGVKTQDK